MVAKKQKQVEAALPETVGRFSAFVELIRGKAKSLRYRDRAMTEKRYRTKEAKADE